MVGAAAGVLCAPGTADGRAGAGGLVAAEVAAGAAADGFTGRGAGPGTPAGFLAGEELLASFSLSRLSTGASTVEDADRTNSPMSFNMVKTVLLSTPSSFASS